MVLNQTATNIHFLNILLLDSCLIHGYIKKKRSNHIWNINNVVALGEVFHCVLCECDTECLFSMCV